MTANLRTSTAPTAIFAFAAIFLGFSAISANGAYPNRADRFVNDYAHSIEPADAAKIRAQLGRLASNTGVSVIVLTIDSFRAYTADDISFEKFATRLFNQWGIGDADRNDGILLLVAKKDRKVRIELGKGYPSSYDARAKEIIDTVIVPNFKAKRFSAGILAGTEAIAEMVAEPVPKRGQTSLLLWILSGTGAIGLGFLGLVLRSPKCPRCDMRMKRKASFDPAEHLSEGQQTEQKLGSANFQLFGCESCRETKIVRRGRWFSGLKPCSHCQFQTLSRKTRVQKRATEYAAGIEQVTENCAHCGHHCQFAVELPILQSSSDDDFSSSSSWSSSGGGGGSDFGGGSSSGGGASGDW